MAAKIVFLAACVALSHAALVKRDAPSPLEDLQKHAEEFQKTFSEQINALVTSKNAQDTQKALKEGSDSVVNQLTAFASTLQTAITEASGKAKEALEQSKANIERTAEELRKSHPEVEQQANALKERITAAVQNTVQESQKLAKTVSDNMEQTNAKLAPKIKEAYDDFVKQMQEVQKKVHEVANKQ